MLRNPSSTDGVHGTGLSAVPKVAQGRRLSRRAYKQTHY
jgi:hypothetical protein